MSKLTIIGVTADGEMSREGRRHLERVKPIFGSPRLLKVTRTPEARAEAIRWKNGTEATLEMLARQKRAAILASGDPMFYGLGSSLASRLGEGRVRAIPSPSAASLAAARLGWPLERVAVVCLHGSSPERRLAALGKYLANGRKIFVLTDNRRDSAKIAEFLCQRGYDESVLHLLEELGGGGERITSFAMARKALNSKATAINIVAISCVRGDFDPTAQTFGIRPEQYQSDRGQISKPPVRSATLAALAPTCGQLLWDIGAGSGSVAIEWMRSAAHSEAIAIEANRRRAAQIRRNAERLGVPQLRVVNAAAPGALAGLPRPDAVFIGGGDKNEETCARIRRLLPKGGRLVATAVTLPSQTALVNQYRSHGGELSRLQIENAEKLGEKLIWRSALGALQYRWLKG